MFETVRSQLTEYAVYIYITTNRHLHHDSTAIDALVSQKSLTREHIFDCAGRPFSRSSFNEISRVDTSLAIAFAGLVLSQQVYAPTPRLTWGGSYAGIHASDWVPVEGSIVLASTQLQWRHDLYV